MRWIVISLLLINALIFGWRWFGPEADVPAATKNRPSAETAHAIELLADEVVEPAEIESAPTQAPLLAEVPPVTADEPIAAEQSAATLASNESANAGTPAGSPPAAAAVATASSSGGTNATTPGASAGSALSAANKPNGPVMHCAWTAWTATLTAAEGAAGSDIAPEVLTEERREFEIARSYLVYIPGKGSREQTLARLAEVKALGVEAAFLNKGPQAGGISLGLFSKPESMQVRLKQLKDAGVTDARGLERVRTEPQSRRLLRWTGEKTPTSVQNQALISCNEIAPAAT